MIQIIIIAINLGTYLMTYADDGIYDEDNRIETYLAPTVIQELSKSVAGFVPKKDLHFTNEKMIVSSPLLKNRINLCEDENFANQPSLVNCTGFLIAPALMATASHCLNHTQNCHNYTWIFDYAYTPHNNEIILDKNNVYECEEIVFREENYSLNKDYAIVRLNRIVKDRLPLTLSTQAPNINDKVFVLGHPSGLPLKYAPDAFINKILINAFKTNLDTFKVNSGSPVFNATDFSVMGILFAGGADYYTDEKHGCERTYQNIGEGDESVSSIQSIIEKLSI